MSFGEGASTFSGNRLPSTRTVEYSWAFTMASKKNPCHGMSKKMSITILSSLSNFDLIILTPIMIGRITSRRSSPHVCFLQICSWGNLTNFEYYHPAIVAHQLGFGQCTIELHLANLVKPRGLLPSAIAYDRLKNLSPPRESIDLSSWRFPIFTTTSFKTWWQEWKNHLFSVPRTILLHTSQP